MDIELKSILQEHGLKVTEVRLQVLKIMMETGAAMSHSDISQKLGDGSIDKVTLYRTLNKFTESGLAHRVATEDRSWLYAIYEKDAHDHHEHEHAHFVCDDCEKIYCFPMESQSIEFKNENNMGFRIRNKEVRLHGTCPVCQ